MKMIERIKYILEPKPTDNVIPYSIKALVKRYTSDNLSQLGGQLAYFFILSIFPFLMAVNGILGKFNVSSQGMLHSLGHLFPDNIIYLLEQYLTQLSHSNHTIVFLVSMVLMVYMATSSVRSLLFSLNHAFRMDGQLTIKKQLSSFPLVLLMIFLIFLSLIFSSIGKIAFEKVLIFFNLNRDWVIVWQIIRWFIPFFSVVIVIFLLYTIIPGREFPKKYTFIGSLFSVTLWIITSIGLSFYTSNFGRYSVVYGSLGAIIIMLLFLYWSGIIIVLGGELAHILAMRDRKEYKYDVLDKYLLNSDYKKIDTE